MQIKNVQTELLHFRLEKPVGGSGVGFVDVLLVEIALTSGETGLGFSYVLAESGAPAAAACKLLAERLQDPALSQLHHPAATWRRLKSGFARSGAGPNFVALAAIDVALWDVYAKAHAQPLGCALGGAPRSTPVYASGGYHPGQTADEVCEVATAHVAAGFAGVKPRVGGAGAALDVLRAVREALPAPIDLMCDANEKCNFAQAQRLLGLAQDLHFLFVEEPLPAHDATGYAALARAFPGLIAAGEHLQGTQACLPFVDGSAGGTFQPDLAMIGGLTPSLEMARIAEAFGVGVAPHFLPGLFVHVAAACPNLTWLEDFPLLEPLFTGWPKLNDGTLAMTDRPGHGLVLASGAKAQFGIEG